MPESVKQRRGESYNKYRQRAGEAGRAEAATEAQRREAAHAPWRAQWEKESGKKYGIATASEYNKWLAEQRKKQAAQKAKGMNAQKQGAALGPKKKE